MVRPALYKRRSTQENACKLHPKYDTFLAWIDIHLKKNCIIITAKTAFEYISRNDRNIHSTLFFFDKNIWNTISKSAYWPATQSKIQYRRHSRLYVQKKNTLWAKRDKHGELSTAYDRMQPAFSGSYKTVAYTFWLSCDRIFTSRTSFGQETDPSEIILLKASTLVPPTTRLVFACNVITSRSELFVQDFKSYTHEFPFKIPGALASFKRFG